ncbi:hypothetical protein HID58_094588 [Brassica napus]|uniref:Uncharacterized protein n=1 Tax=Brassica napus TaxID=3708 RepID=A0ABQ7X718_BRANA|nr:hypothetical protein HID58_094588 [Brassica napus]
MLLAEGNCGMRSGCKCVGCGGDLAKCTQTWASPARPHTTRLLSSRCSGYELSVRGFRRGLSSPRTMPANVDLTASATLAPANEESYKTLRLQ